MKVKEVIEFLLKLDPEKDVFVNGSQLNVNTATDLFWSDYFHRTSTQEEIDKSIAFREKILAECTARKNSNKYKDTLSALKSVKESKLIPYINLTYLTTKK